MIPTIGVMIGLYIIARCSEMWEHSQSGAVKFLAAVAAIVSLIGVFGLLISGLLAAITT